MQNVNITFITDSNYVLPTWITIKSVVCSKVMDYNLKVYIIADRLSSADKDCLKKTCLDSEGRVIETAEIIFIDVDGKKDFEKLADKNVLSGWSAATLFKLTLADILPDDCHKVIYLDGDMIIRQDLSSLFNIDLGMNYIGAVRDTFYDVLAHEKRLDLDGKYVNTGCLLLNLDLMRSENVVKKLIQKKREDSSLGLADQDVYNVVCRDRVLLLPCKYNFYVTHFLMHEDIDGFKRYTTCPYDSKEEMIGDIAVIHMIHTRPWKLSCTKKEFLNLLDSSVKVPTINDSVMKFILLQWLNYYKTSPLFKEDGANIRIENFDVSFSKNGLKSRKRICGIQFHIFQDCVRGGVIVSVKLLGIPLFSKCTLPDGKVTYRIFK